MKICAVIFTYPPDYVAAVMTARSLKRLGVEAVIAVDSHDPLLHVDGFRVVRTGFKRNGNLNGTECIVGELDTMAEISEGYDYCIKADSDVLVTNLKWLEGRTENAVGVYVREMTGMQGSCYALRAAAISPMLQRARALAANVHLPEDRTIGQIAKDTGPVHLPVQGKDHTGVVAYHWDQPRTYEDYFTNFSVVVFDRRSHPDNKLQIAEMKKFLCALSS